MVVLHQDTPVDATVATSRSVFYISLVLTYLLGTASAMYL